MDKHEKHNRYESLYDDPIIKSASERAKNTKYGAMLEHHEYGQIMFDNRGNIISVIPYAIVMEKMTNDKEKTIDKPTQQTEGFSFQNSPESPEPYDFSIDLTTEGPLYHAISQIVEKIAEKKVNELLRP